MLFLGFYAPVTMDLGWANRNGIRLVTSRGEGRAAVGRALELAGAGLLQNAQLVTHRCPLADIQLGLDAMRSRDSDRVKVVFTP